MVSRTSKFARRSARSMMRPPGQVLPLALVVGDDRRIERAAFHLRHQLLGKAGDDLDVQIRIALANNGQHGRQDAGQRRADRAEPDAAFDSAFRRERGLQLVVARDQVARFGDQRLAGLVQHRRPLGAVEESDVQLGLQAAHLRADGGFAQVQRARGGGEGA
jgi:hypothetical protein